MQFVDHSRQNRVCTVPPVRATALINQLVGHLLPAMSYCSYDHLVRDEYIVEHHLIEIVLSGQIDDRPDKIGRAHVCTPVTNAHLVCRLLIDKKNTIQIIKTSTRSYIS